MKRFFLAIACAVGTISSAFASGDSSLAAYYIGVDGSIAPRNGTDGNPYPNNPNHNRLTMLYAHSYVGNTFPTKIINHYHPLGGYRYNGPSTSPTTSFSNARTPEGTRDPLSLQPGIGVFENKYVSNLGSPTSSAYQALEIRSIESLRSGAGPTGTAPSVPFAYFPSVHPDWEAYLNTASGAWLMLNSSPMTATFAEGNGQFSGSVTGVSLGMELLSITSGLNVFNTTGSQLFSSGPGAIENLGLLDANFSFTPVFGTEIGPTETTAFYDARFRFVDLANGSPFGNSGEFRYSFQVAAIPEPTSLALVGLAMAGCFMRRYRNRETSI
jgi:hypothetical protein